MRACGVHEGAPRASVGVSAPRTRGGWRDGRWSRHEQALRRAWASVFDVRGPGVFDVHLEATLEDDTVRLIPRVGKMGALLASEEAVRLVR